MSYEFLFFGGFCLFIVCILLVDLLVIGKNSHVVSFKEAIVWTSVWVSFALVLYLLLRFHGDKLHNISSPEQLKQIASQYAPHLKLASANFAENLDTYRSNMATEYITGYLIEYTLSIDNIFVIMMLLSAFSVELKNYKKVLFWGILGAILLRCFFIFVGSALVHQFEWLLLVFGGFLVFSGIKMIKDINKEETIETEKHWLVRFLSKRFPVHKTFVGSKFVVKIDGRKMITPLFIVLILIEFTDLLFALDSIPAIFAITKDPYIIFFSNIFAIIGLRSLFFLISRVIDLFHYLKIGISGLLIFIGFKLLFHSWLDSIGFEASYSLYIILGVFVVSIGMSLLFPPKKKTENN